MLQPEVAQTGVLLLLLLCLLSHAGALDGAAVLLQEITQIINLWRSHEQGQLSFDSTGPTPATTSGHRRFVLCFCRIKRVACRTVSKLTSVVRITREGQLCQTCTQNGNRQ